MRADGSRFNADVVLTALFDSDGRLTGYGKVVRDVTERRTAASEAIHRSTHDALTGLPNRAQLLEALDNALRRPQRPGRVAIISIDLDPFKTVNDTLGQEAGDRLLREISRRLLRSVRQEDTVARLGSDEFAVLCEDLPGSTSAVDVAHSILTGFAPLVRLGGEERTISASVGVASTTEDGGDAVNLLSDAHAAMKLAKRGDGSPYA